MDDLDFLDDALNQIVAAVGLVMPKRHIFLCCDQTEPKCCTKERGLAAWEYLKKRLRELELSESGGVLRTKANCFRVCREGPIAVVYPEGAWYRGCDPAVLEEIIQRHLIGGEIAQEHCFAVRPLQPSRDRSRITNGNEYHK